MAYVSASKTSLLAPRWKRLLVQPLGLCHMHTAPTPPLSKREPAAHSLWAGSCGWSLPDTQAWCVCVCVIFSYIYKLLFDTWNRSDWWLLLVVFWLSVYWLLFLELLRFGFFGLAVFCSGFSGY